MVYTVGLTEDSNVTLKIRTDPFVHVASRIASRLTRFHWEIGFNERAFNEFRKIR